MVAAGPQAVITVVAAAKPPAADSKRPAEITAAIVVHPVVGVGVAAVDGTVAAVAGEAGVCGRWVVAEAVVVVAAVVGAAEHCT
jgi:hypothetical protein